MQKFFRKHSLFYYTVLEDKFIVNFLIFIMLVHHKYAVAFACLEKATPLRLRKIFAYFKDLEKAWKFGRAEEFVAAGLEWEVANDLMKAREKVNPEIEEQKINQFGVEIILFGSEKYPKYLAEIHNPPALLFVRGKILPADRFALAIVGSRMMSTYGRQVTNEIARETAKRGITIISGLAAGVDAEAHKAALSVGGRTIGVLGCGVDFIYPPQNKKLATEILESGGALISEYPMGTGPTAYNFPQRNRIIAGLSQGVLVTEAREKSGALITAQIALEENREVFAVPGDIFRLGSGGTSKLIKTGAHPVTSAEDIAEILNFNAIPEKLATEKIAPSSAIEAKLRSLLDREPVHIDQLARESQLSSSAISSELVILEMKGLAKNLGGMMWVKG